MDRSGTVTGCDNALLHYDCVEQIDTMITCRDVNRMVTDYFEGAMGLWQRMGLYINRSAPPSNSRMRANLGLLGVLETD